MRFSAQSASTTTNERSQKLDLSTVRTTSEVAPRTRPRIFGLKEAPTYTPTKAEFADPIKYIQKIHKEGEKYGIIKIIPPKDYEPGFWLNTEVFRFRTRMQKLNSMEGETRAKVNYLEQLYKYHRLAGHPVNKIPQLDKRPIDLYKLKKEVSQRGGYDTVTLQKKWAEVGRVLGYTRKQCTSMSNSLKSAYHRTIFPYETWLSQHKQQQQQQDATSSSTASPVPTAPSATDTDRDSQRSASPGSQNCETCGRDDQADKILLCDGCDNAYHIYCLAPPLSEVPTTDWYCVKCLTSAGHDYGFEDGGEYSLNSFQKVCSKFKREWFSKNESIKDSRNVAEEDCEDEFWRLVENPHETCSVEYGADLHSTQHGSGFASVERDVQFVHDPWNLNTIPVLPQSLFTHIKSDISGMMVPWLYVGMCFSAFCWHNEDHYTYSINYMHWGETKTWYGIPGMDTEKFEDTMRKAVPELFEQQPDLLFQLVTMLSPGRLLDNGVDVYAVDQRPGQFVVTFPKAYHSGFNHGFNFCEAVNFAPLEWIDYGLECVKRYKEYRRQPCFSHDELLVTTATTDSSVETARLLKEPLKEMLSRELDERRRLRKALPRLIETVDSHGDNAEKEYQCAFCNCYTYLSRVGCDCTPQVSCLDHHAELCSCDAEKKQLHLCMTDEALKALVQKALSIANQPSPWSEKASKCLTSSSPLTIKPLKQLLREVPSYADEAEVDKVREHLKFLESEADKARRQSTRKRRPRDLSDELALPNMSLKEERQDREHRKQMRLESVVARDLPRLVEKCGGTDMAMRPTLSAVRRLVSMAKSLPLSPLDGLDTLQQALERVEEWDEQAGSLLVRDAEASTVADAMEILLERMLAITHPKQGDLYCICRRREAGLMIECDVCHEWYHSSCVQLSRREAKEQAFFVCPVCESKPFKTRRGPALEEVQDLVAQADSLPAQPDTLATIKTMVDELLGYRDKIHQFCRSKPQLGLEDLDTIKAYLRELEGLPIALVDETDFLRKKAHMLSMVTDSNESVYCICRRGYNPNEQMIGCDVCHDWFHLACVNLTPETIDHQSYFTCPECTRKQAHLPPSHAMPSSRPVIKLIIKPPLAPKVDQKQVKRKHLAMPNQDQRKLVRHNVA